MSKGRIETEKKALGKMIHIYCKGQKHNNPLCRDCRELLDYAQKKLDSCVFGNKKTFCSKCAVHCYNQKMRERIRKVMRYSGPRMLLRDPIMAFRHLLGR